MKKQFVFILLVMLSSLAMAQEKCYWVFFTDKNGTQFDPYSYFDAKAIARYQQCGADLYDISNYPLNDDYVNTVDAYSSELFGHSRWLNAVGIMATEENAYLISQLPFVANIQEIESDFVLTSEHNNDFDLDDFIDYSESDLSYQLIRFGGDYFEENGLDGTGLRICVMDGGFPKVNTHRAFQHLRDNNQILMTYNFPNKKEDVYGWSTHGTMVLSCIAGMSGDTKLGLATGAEFLLARTEVDPEPFKEEVWWAQGAEWADKNGADIINSSLGYGKDRHWTREMNGRSYVAKAANMAVEKGILVCNSAGNEGDDSTWMTIITPSDAENVLCVAGLEPSLNHYQRIDFSSLGPTADKRRKPNVCAFGYAKVADPSDGDFTGAYGTSFSSPLVAGFCACAWQTCRDLTALQMKEEIEKSADLYPYFDYAYGYGVPQAAYFTGDLELSAKSVELFEDKNGNIHIHFTGINFKDDVFVNVEGPDGVLLGYYKLDRSEIDDDVVIKKQNLGKGTKLNVSYNGYYASYPLKGTGVVLNPFLRDSDYLVDYQNSTFPIIKQEAWENERYFQYDYVLGNGTWNGFNRHFAFGKRWMYGKTYKIGMGLSLDFNRFVCHNQKGILTPPHEKAIMRSMQVQGEVFQRILNRMWGMNWDLGVYGGVNLTRSVKTVDSYTWNATDGTPLDPQPYSANVTSIYDGCKAMNRFQYGLTTRIGYNTSKIGNISIYANYRLSNIILRNDPVLGNPAVEPSRWSFGIELEL